MSAGRTLAEFPGTAFARPQTRLPRFHRCAERRLLPGLPRTSFTAFDKGIEQCE